MGDDLDSKVMELQSIVDTANSGKDKNNSEILIKRDDEEILSKTELSPEQIMSVTKLQTLSDLTDNDIIDNFVNNFLHAQLSKGRMSRREFISNNQSLFNKEVERNQGMGGWFNQKV